MQLEAVPVWILILICLLFVLQLSTGKLSTIAKWKVVAVNVDVGVDAVRDVDAIRDDVSVCVSVKDDGIKNDTHAELNSDLFKSGFGLIGPRTAGDESHTRPSTRERPGEEFRPVALGTETVEEEAGARRLHFQLVSILVATMMQRMTRRALLHLLGRRRIALLTILINKQPIANPHRHLQRRSVLLTLLPFQFLDNVSV